MEEEGIFPMEYNLSLKFSYSQKNLILKLLKLFSKISFVIFAFNLSLKLIMSFFLGLRFDLIKTFQMIFLSITLFKFTVTFLLLIFPLRRPGITLYH